MLTPLKTFQQVRPSFEHVDEERSRRTIQTKDQMQREQAAANKLTRLGLSAGGTAGAGQDRRAGKKDADLIDVEWTTLRHYQQDSAASTAMFQKLA